MFLTEMYQQASVRGEPRTPGLRCAASLQVRLRETKPEVSAGGRCRACCIKGW